MSRCLSSAKQHYTFPNLLRPDGSFVTQNKDKASVLAEEFSKNFNGNDCDALEIPEVPEIDDAWLCAPEEISDYIRLLKNTSAMGRDFISPRLLKNCIEEIAPAISILLNRCLQEMRFPDCWKHARICAIAKVNGTQLPSEFRPISILPSLSKLAERWILRIIRPMIFDPPDKNQFAYLPGRSVDDALAVVQNLIVSGFNACEHVAKVAVVSLDVRKAFDQVPKNSLLKHLQPKLPPALIALLNSYLSDRKQTVSISGEDSEPMYVKSGVVQGSMVGPNLFIYYISSVLNIDVSLGTKLVAYADDLVVIKPITSELDCIALQRDLDAIIRGYSDLFLSVNPSKSNYLLCTLREPHMAQTLDRPLCIDGTPIARVEVMKYLGVFLDHKLSFGKHIENITLRTKRATGALWRSIGKWAGRNVFTNIYTKVILPIMCHALPMVAPANQKHWVMLERTQKFAAKLATNTFNLPYNDLLLELHWKPIARLCTERQLLTVRKWTLGTRFLPDFVLHEAEPLRRRHNILQNDNRLRVNDKHLSTLRRIPFRVQAEMTPLHYAVSAWNLMPEWCLDLQISDFKKEIRKIETFIDLEARAPNAYNGRTSPPLAGDYKNL